MAKAALYKKNNRPPFPASHQAPKNNYSRKAFNNLNKVQAQNVDFKRISTILQKFTKRHALEIMTFAIIAFIVQSFFIGLLTLDSVKTSSKALFMSTIGAVFLSNIIIAYIGLNLSKKLLLSQEERQHIPPSQGAMRYVGFAFIMSFISLMMGLGVQMIAGSYSLVASSIVALIGTLIAACMATMIVVQYGLILPAAATNRKSSMAIACGQVRPFWISLFVPIFSCKALMALCVFVVSVLSLPTLISSLIVALLSSICSMYIYLALSASYAAAGYLFNMDYDIQKDDFR